MSIYVSPFTALEYLLRSGLTKRGVARYAGVNNYSVYRILKRKNDPTYVVRPAIGEKLRQAFERRREEMEQDAAIRKEMER